MPEQGVKMLPHNQILTFEEISEVVKIAVSLGVSKVRITGGEPLVRHDIVHLMVNFLVMLKVSKTSQ
jgi:GTP 3',8-cyclase